MSGQTTIPVEIDGEFTFRSFVIGNNLAVVDALVAATNGSNHSLHYLWGDRGSGKTHLLQACVDLAKSTGRGYLFVNQSNFSAQSLGHQDIPEDALVCFDDIDRIAGNRDTALVILSWIEQAKQVSGTVVASGQLPLHKVSLGLPDLSSRLSAGPSYQLENLDDSGLRQALTDRSVMKGFDLEPQVVDFILRRYPRDTASLFDLLDRMDRVSLSSQRKITIPFVSSLIS